MEPFKNLYNDKSIMGMAQIIQSQYPGFKHREFAKNILSTLAQLEMKDRVRLISSQLKNYLPDNYEKAVEVLVNSLAPEASHENSEWQGDCDNGLSGFMVWPLTQFVEDYGLDYFETSMAALYEMTKRFTAEFAIRAFIREYDKQVYALLKKWSRDKNKHVRRLVSEGTRPNLPWGVKVESILSNLERNIGLLNSLKNDPDEYVLRSVANHMNDISHHNATLALDTLKVWKDGGDDMTWPIRHATRTLLKQGHSKALRLNGYSPQIKINLKKLSLSSSEIKVGEFFDIYLDLQFLGKKEQKLIVNYIIHFRKKNGQLSPKVFRFKDLKVKEGERFHLKKKHSFKKITTRKHYAGKHLLEIQVNGRILGQQFFYLC